MAPWVFHRVGLYPVPQAATACEPGRAVEVVFLGGNVPPLPMVRFQVRVPDPNAKAGSGELGALTPLPARCRGRTGPVPTVVK